MAERRVAVLVDGDNVSSKNASWVLTAAAKLGRIDISRVYASLNRPSDWLTTPGYRLMHAGSAKNAADMLLSIDAMEMALIDEVETFVIATSDRDLTHLAQRLREKGAHVLGLGEEKAPEDFRMACSAFRVLGSTGDATAPPARTSGVSEFDQKIRSMIAQHSQGGRGMLISKLAPKMHAAHGTRISARPERNWRGYLEARPQLYEIEPKGPDAKVRFLPAGFAMK